MTRGSAESIIIDHLPWPIDTDGFHTDGPMRRRENTLCQSKTPPPKYGMDTPYALDNG